MQEPISWRFAIVILGVIAIFLLLAGAARAEVIGGRPAGCPRAFCGCALSLDIFKKIIPRLNLAANWLRFPRVKPAPGMVVARRGHVMKLVKHVKGNRWVVWTANSCGGRICVKTRSIAAYTAVNPYEWMDKE